MNTEQLIEFLAGERIPSRSGLYRWWLQRVAEAVEFGVLTDYLVIGRPRWSPTEAAGVKDALDGIKGGTRTRAQEARHALAAKMVGLAGVAEAVRLKGVKRKTAEGWSGQGDRPVRFGARRVGGEVFFELAQLEAYTPTIPAEKAITIMRKCAGAGCVAQVPRTPSQIERTRDSYCSDCWSVISGTAQHLELLRDGLRTLEENNPEELFRRRSEGQQRREGKRGGSAGDATAILKAHNSPTKKRKRLTEMKLTRGGSLPSDEQMARWDEQANSRRARSADRSAKSQDLASKLVAALERGLTLTAAAQQEGCEFRTAQRLVRAAGVGPRQPGRPAKARAA